MLNTQALSIILGTSTFLGVIALMAYLYFLQQTQRIERSVRQIVEGDGLADKVLDVLKAFNDDNARLEALKSLTQNDIAKANALLEKIGNDIDINTLNKASTNYYKSISGYSALVFSLFALLALAYYFIKPSHTPVTPIPAPVIAKVESRFDVKFGEPHFLKIKNKIRANVTIEAIPMTKNNDEAATIFIGMITVHNEDEIDLNRDTQHSSCKDTPSCLGVKIFKQNIIVRGGNTEHTNIPAVFDLPANIKHVRFYGEFYQKEAKNGGECVVDNSKLFLTDGIPFLKVISKEGAETKDLCFEAFDEKIVAISLL